MMLRTLRCQAPLARGWARLSGPSAGSVSCPYQACSLCRRLSCARTLEEAAAPPPYSWLPANWFYWSCACAGTPGQKVPAAAPPYKEAGRERPQACSQLTGAEELAIPNSLIITICKLLSAGARLAPLLARGTRHGAACWQLARSGCRMGGADRHLHEKAGSTKHAVHKQARQGRRACSVARAGALPGVIFRLVIRRGRQELFSLLRVRIRRVPQVFALFV